MYVLLVDDDTTLLALLKDGLLVQGITVETTSNIAEGQLSLSYEAFDAVVLDINLPDGSGLDLLGVLRRHDPLMPVLLMTSRDAVEERVRGLDSGADDYLSKPFRVIELAARLRAITRRRAYGEITLARAGIVLDASRLAADVDGRRVLLSPRELALLDTLMRRPGMILSKQDLEARLYGWQDGVESNAIEVHVHNLRGKIGRHRIETVRGVGYRLRSTG